MYLSRAAMMFLLVFAFATTLLGGTENECKKFEQWICSGLCVSEESLDSRWLVESTGPSMNGAFEILQGKCMFHAQATYKYRWHLWKIDVEPTQTTASLDNACFRVQ